MDVHPGKGVGTISLGMSRAQVASAVGETPERFRKTPMCRVDTDAFDSIGVHVYYNDEDSCEYIECYREDDRRLVHGVPVLDLPVHEVLARLSRYCDLEASDQGCCYTDPQTGITLWRSSADESPFEAVGVAAPSYFGPAV